VTSKGYTYWRIHVCYTVCSKRNATDAPSLYKHVPPLFAKSFLVLLNEAWTLCQPRSNSTESLANVTKTCCKILSKETQPTCFLFWQTRHSVGSQAEEITAIFFCIASSRTIASRNKIETVHVRCQFHPLHNAKR